MASRLIRNYRAGQHVVLADQSRRQTIDPSNLSPEEQQQLALEESIRKNEALRHELERELAQVEAKRKEILQKAEIQVATMEAEAQAKGFEEGYSQGIAEGQSAAEGEMAGLIGQMAHLLNQIDQERAGIFLSASEQVAHLAMALCEKVVGHMAQNHESLIVHTVNRALAGLAEGGSLVIRLHPDDKAFLQEFWSTQTASDEFKDWRLVGDPEIEQGGCVLSCGPANVDARLSTQMQALVDGLMLSDYQLRGPEKQAEAQTETQRAAQTAPQDESEAASQPDHQTDDPIEAQVSTPDAEMPQPDLSQPSVPKIEPAETEAPEAEPAEIEPSEMMPSTVAAQTPPAEVVDQDFVHSESVDSHAAAPETSQSPAPASPELNAPEPDSSALDSFELDPAELDPAEVDPTEQGQDEVSPPDPADLDMPGLELTQEFIDSLIAESAETDAVGQDEAPPQASVNPTPDNLTAENSAQASPIQASPIDEPTSGAASVSDAITDELTENPTEEPTVQEAGGADASVDALLSGDMDMGMMTQEQISQLFAQLNEDEA